jgi:GntR family transcriptional repressor for pyruvate dehydrogenase complex
VSKRVIREALRALTAQGIVKTSQGKRAVVANAQPVALEAYFKFMRQLDSRAIAELFELREIIEVGAASLAATRAIETDLEPARKALISMAEAGTNAEQLTAGDLAFHAAIINAAHNRFLSAIVDALSGALWEERTLGVLDRLDAGRGPEAALREHRAVLDAVAARDAEAAARHMIEHLRTGRAYIPPGAPPEGANNASAKNLRRLSSRKRPARV